jgi:hypothetical protein
MLECEVRGLHSGVAEDSNHPLCGAMSDEWLIVIIIIIIIIIIILSYYYVYPKTLRHIPRDLNFHIV